MAVLLQHFVDRLACLDREVEEELVGGRVDDGVGVFIQKATEVVVVRAVLRLGLVHTVQCIADVPWLL